MKIDIFCHFLPKKYFEILCKKAKAGVDFSRTGSWTQANPALGLDLEVRLQAMDHHPDVTQVLTLATPPVDTLVGPKEAVELAKIANDEMASLVCAHPDRFVGAVATLPLMDIDAAILEADRAIRELHLQGVQIFSNINGDLLDAPRFRPLYEAMVRHDLPLWIHPWYPEIMNVPAGDFPPPIQEWLRHLPMGSFIWPFDTSLAMMTLVNAGILKDYPTIKFITHHCGGMVPYFGKRMKRVANAEDLTKFYNDTALYGNTSALMCGYDFFGPERLLFGTDMPLGSTHRPGHYGYTAATIEAIEGMAVTEAVKKKIFQENARQLLKLNPWPEGAVLMASGRKACP